MIEQFQIYCCCTVYEMYLL